MFASNEVLNYKDIVRLRRCIDERGKIVGRRKTGVSAAIHRADSAAIRRDGHVFPHFI